MGKEGGVLATYFNSKNLGEGQGCLDTNLVKIKGEGKRRTLNRRKEKD